MVCWVAAGFPTATKPNMQPVLDACPTSRGFSRASPRLPELGHAHLTVTLKFSSQGATSDQVLSAEPQGQGVFKSQRSECNWKQTQAGPQSRSQGQVRPRAPTGERAHPPHSRLSRDHAPGRRTKMGNTKDRFPRSIPCAQPGLSLPLCLCVSLCVSPYLCLCLSLPSLSVSVSLFESLCVSLPVPLSVSLPPLSSCTVCLCVCLPTPPAHTIHGERSRRLGGRFPA